MRGRREEGAGVPRTLEWIGLDDAGEPIARVVRVQGPLCTGWRRFQAVALDADAKVVELPCGHYTLGESPFKFIDGYQICSFLLRNL